MGKGEIGNQLVLIRDYCRAGYRKVVIAAAGTSLLNAVLPFIPMILTSALLDGILRGAALAELFRITALALGGECLCLCGYSVFLEIYNQRHEFMHEQLNGLLNKKLLTMDYGHLENPQVHRMIHGIRNADIDHGLLGLILEDWRRLLEASAAIIAAILVAAPLFIRAKLPEEGVALAGAKVGVAVFAESWQASVLLFVAIGGLTLFTYRMDIRCGEQIRETHKRRAGRENLLGYYMSIFAGCEKQKDLRINGQQELISRCTDEASDGVSAEVGQEARLSARGEAVRRTVSALVGLLAYLFAGMRAYLGMITVGSAVLYASGIIQMSQSMSQFMEAVAMSRSHRGYARDYVRVSSLKKESGGKAGREAAAASLPGDRASITVNFDHVFFHYPGSSELVLQDLNFQFSSGRKIAVVGRNGSGKTTFIKLLCRLYEPTQGSIQVNGRDAREYGEEEYYRLLAVVFQDFRIFAFELGENISGNKTADQAKAEDAFQKAGLGERYARLPQRLHTFVGKEYDASGVNFSGGELQKIAIARAVYRDAPLVVMDEPTAALDPVSEHEVYAGFDRMVGERTAIYISHRLASCRFCKDILVFDKGEVVQRGCHDELIGQEGLYRELWNAQAQYYVREEDHT